MLLLRPLPWNAASVRQYFTGPVTPIPQLRKELVEYPGGRVTCSRDDTTGLARLRLAHPEACNALSGAMMAELSDHVRDLEKWERGKAVILSGETNRKNLFCSGGDLNVVKQLDTHEKGFKVSTFMTDILRRLQQLPLVTVTLLQGGALGGGAELAAATDFRLVTPGSYLAFVQTRMGLCTGFGGGCMLVDHVGYSRALELLLSGRKLKVDEGLSWGFYTRQLGEADPEAECEAWLLQRLGKTSPEVVQGTKAVLRRNTDTVAGMPGHEMDSRIFASLWRGKANRAALGANIKHSD